MRVNHSTNTVSVNSSSGFTEQASGRIEKVLLLNGDASSGLAALLGNLELIAATPGIILAANQREALMGLREAAYGY